ncbi:hypothetical protein HDV00_008730 [Rhizophlyctis rosea]|nr:hypothetical protein HDV00_008730 [Rhizophlyctis rosea]
MAFPYVVVPITPEPVHAGKICNVCGRKGFPGVRYKCAQCFQYDVCDVCFGSVGERHVKGHRFRAKAPARAGDGRSGGQTQALWRVVDGTALTRQGVRAFVIAFALRDPEKAFDCLSAVVGRFKLPFELRRDELPSYPDPAAVEREAAAMAKLAEWAQAEREREEREFREWEERERVRQMRELAKQEEEERRRKWSEHRERERMAGGVGGLCAGVYLPGPFDDERAVLVRTPSGRDLEGNEVGAQVQPSMSIPNHEGEPAEPFTKVDKGKGRAADYPPLSPSDDRNSQSAHPIPPTAYATPTPSSPSSDSDLEVRSSAEWVERVRIGDSGSVLRL